MGESANPAHTCVDRHAPDQPPTCDVPQAELVADGSKILRLSGSAQALAFAPDARSFLAAVGNIPQMNGIGLVRACPQDRAPIRTICDATGRTGVSIEATDFPSIDDIPQPRPPIHGPRGALRRQRHGRTRGRAIGGTRGRGTWLALRRTAGGEPCRSSSQDPCPEGEHRSSSVRLRSQSDRDD